MAAVVLVVRKASFITVCNCKKTYDRKTSAELSLKRTPAESKCVHSALEYYSVKQPDSD